MRICMMTVVIGLFLSAGVPSQTVAATTHSQARIIHFPVDRSLGKLWLRDADAVEPDDARFVESDAQDYLGPAQGDVAIAAGKHVCLMVSPTAAGDLSPLGDLRPDDLHKLYLAGHSPNHPKPGDKCMEHIAKLTGLKVLVLEHTNTTDRGLAHLRQMTALERLKLSCRVSDRGMAHVAALPALKRLDFGDNRVTDAGLVHLARLKSLEKMSLGGPRMTDAGLVHLAALPSLRCLFLYGGFTDAGMAHVKNIPSLKTLRVGTRQFSDVGLRHLAEIPTLEHLSLHHVESITDRSVVCLKKLPALKSLDVTNSHVTDAGLAHLKGMKSLEDLQLPLSGISDVGLEHLSQLPNLKRLRIVRCVYANPGQDSGYYTDKGIHLLARCGRLEDLAIGSIGVTDAALADIARLSHLQRLILLGCRRVTDEGLARLSALKNLHTLCVDSADVTVSGLASLNVLSHLRTLDVSRVRHGEGVLDVSGLTNLEKLTVGLERGESLRDGDLASLAGLKNLRQLQLTPQGVSNAGLRHVAGLKNLWRLGIGGDDVSDAGLAHLANLQKLTMLHIAGRFTDEALPHLARLQSLAAVTFRGDAAFTATALERLRGDRPGLTLRGGFSLIHDKPAPGRASSAGSRRSRSPRTRKRR